MKQIKDQDVEHTSLQNDDWLIAQTAEGVTGKIQKGNLMAQSGINANNWIIKNSDYIMSLGEKIIFTETATLTLPPNPTEGSSVSILNVSSGTISIGRNGKKIQSTNYDAEFTIKSETIELIYCSDSVGWIPTRTALINLIGVKLIGTSFGTSPYSSGSEFSKAFDGSFTSFFDSATASNGYCGLELPAPNRILKIKYAPRAGNGARMLGGVFQGSNSLNSGYTTIARILTTPSDNIFSELLVTDTTPYKFVRYLGDVNSYCNVSEIEFYG